MGGSRLLVLLCGLGAASFAGCDSPVDAGGYAATLTAGGETFALRNEGGAVETEIPFSYTNDSDRPIYLAEYCAGPTWPYLEKKVGDSWEPAWGATVSSCGRWSIVLEPGGTLDDVIVLIAHPFGGKVYPQFHFEEVEGTYRLRWAEEVVLTGNHGTQIPPGPPIDDRYRVSGEFTLTLP